MKFSIPDKSNLEPLQFEYIDRTIDQYYRPVQGYFMTKRLRLAYDILLSDYKKPFDKILDIGYGGGTFIPALSKISNTVYGIDLHTKMSIVKRILKKEGTNAILSKDSIFKSKFSSNYFDCIVCISVFEHFKGDELRRATNEIHRILKKDGIAVIGFPTKNIISNLIIEHILKFEPDHIHPSGHTDIIQAFYQEFKNINTYRYPAFLPVELGLYVLVKVCKK